MKSEVTFIELDETVSTNTFLATYRAAEPSSITVATAEYQSAGRGQTGNSWESEKGKNLLFSILVRPKTLPATHVFLLSEAIALSIREVIADALRSASPHLPPPLQGGLGGGAFSVTVKWPNDIYVDDRKIAGILIENELCGHNVGRSIIGCGVNINQQSFLFPSLTSHLSPLTSHPSARACSLDTSRIINHQSSIINHQSPTPVSLHQLIGHDCDRRPILNHILDAFQQRYASLTPHPSSLHADYLAALYRRTGLHPYRDAHGQFDAEIIDVEPSGHLILRDMSGTIRRYAFKEVEYLRCVDAPLQTGGWRR